MKINKNKIFAIAISIALIISIFVVSSVADTNTATVSISIDKTELSAGETATVTVSATANFSVATASIPVFYDKTLVSVSDIIATLSDYTVAEVTTLSDAVDTTKIYNNTDLDSDKFGFILVTYIGDANGTVAETLDATVLTFTITALADVTGEAVVKCVSESAKTDENIEGMLYFGASTSGTTITSIPENVENVNLESASAAVDIVTKTYIKLKDSAPYDAIIDTNNKPEGYTGIIYGVDTLGQDETLEADGALTDFLTTAYGDENLEIIVGDSGMETTGTVINVLDENDNIVESYVFVCFGDVNGDGAVDITDSADIEAHDQWVVNFDKDSAAYYAADVNGDGAVDITDSADVEAHDQWVEMLPSQAEIAASRVANQ